MNARDIISRLNKDIVLKSNVRQCGEWKPTNKTEAWVAYNVSMPPHLGPNARKIIIRLKSVAKEPCKLEVAFYVREDDRCYEAFHKRYEEQKENETWFPVEGKKKSGCDSGVKSIIPLATVGELEWQGVVASELDRLFKKYAAVVEAKP